jgi:hypothetical protein
MLVLLLLSITPFLLMSLLKDLYWQLPRELKMKVNVDIFDITYFSKAIKKNDIALFKTKIIYPIDNYTSWCVWNDSVKMSRLSIMKLLNENDVPVSREIFNVAVEIGNLQVVEWLYSTIPLWGAQMEKLLSIAIGTGRIPIIKWVINNLLDDSAIINFAAGSIEDSAAILKWLIDNTTNITTPQFIQEVLITAIKNTNIAVLDFIAEHGRLIVFDRVLIQKHH